MSGYPKVKGYLVEHGIKQKDVAKLLGMTVTTVNNKLNGIGDFSMKDVRIMCEKLGIGSELFFIHYVPKKEQQKEETNE